MITDRKGEVVEDDSKRRSSQESNVDDWDEECKVEINDDVTHSSHTKQSHLAMDFPGVDGDVFAPNGSEETEKADPRQKRISWRDDLEDSSDDDDGDNRQAAVDKKNHR